MRTVALLEEAVLEAEEAASWKGSGANSAKHSVVPLMSCAKVF